MPPSSDREFRVGDKVRLRAKPEVTGKVTTSNGGTSVGWTDDAEDVFRFRFPEELEHVPEPKMVEVPEGKVAVMVPAHVVRDGAETSYGAMYYLSPSECSDLLAREGNQS